MARPQPTDPKPAAFPWTPDDRGYRPGGAVGQMQADLVHRLSRGAGIWEPVEISSGERAVRLASVAGGYVALLAGYAGAAFLMLR